MMWVLLLLLSTACLGGDSVGDLGGDSVGDPPVAQLPQGTMVGTWFTTREGRNIEGYLGIPFAAPPLGPLRFKPPQPPPEWEGVFYANKGVDQCIQAIDPIGVEDCLYLNVYTPQANPELELAVMVWIYGGAFELGSSSSSMYGPHYVLDEDVVLVTLNYRLGVLGFLSLENHVLPGNLGLKDQRAALRWVQRNIRYFGGDPLKVTIWGESSGAASVHFHMKFNNREGLFRAAIANSGSAFDCWAFQPPGSQQIYVDAIADGTGCNTNDSHAFVECLRGVPAENFGQILTALLINSDALERKISLLTPMVEPPGTEGAFITADPWTVPTATPFLTGVTEYECLTVNIPPFLDQDPTNQRFFRFNQNYTHYMPLGLQYNFTAEDPVLVSQLLKEFYLGNETFSRENYLDIVDLYSDGTFISGAVRGARSNRQKTYFYYFTYAGLYSTVFIMGSLQKRGPGHADDLFFFFHLSLPPDPDPLDIAQSKKMVKMWTNFAKYIDPTPGDDEVQWKPICSPNIEYLHIGQTNFTMEKDFLKPRMDFWDKLPFRNKPFQYKWPSTSSRALTPGKIREKYLVNRQGQQTYNFTVQLHGAEHETSQSLNSSTSFGN